MYKKVYSNTIIDAKLPTTELFTTLELLNLYDRIKVFICYKLNEEYRWFVISYKNGSQINSIDNSQRMS
jgi:hypothetical protein